MSCRVVALTTAQWRAVVTANPYPSQTAADPKTVHAAVQQDEVTQAQCETLKQLLAEVVADGGQDHLTVVGRTTYLCTPGGLGRSRLADRLARRKGTQDAATARNWRTVEAVASLLGG